MTINIKRLFWAGGAPPPPPPSPPATAAPADAAHTGDARVDQVLAAFEAMKAAMPAPQLAIAIGATAGAIGVEPALVVETLGQRLLALDGTLGNERRIVAERHAARTAELATVAASVEADVKAMEDKIAALRKRLAAATADLDQHHAAEQARIAELDRKAREATWHSPRPRG